MNSSPTKRLAVFDLDGTITREDSFLAFLLFAYTRQPRRWWRAPLLACAVVMHKTGLKPNDWLKSFFLRHVLGHLTRTAREEMVQAFLPGFLSTHLRNKARDQIHAHRLAGEFILLLSASPDFIVRPIAADLGIEEVICTVCAEDAQTRLTGTLKGGNCYGPEKGRRLEAWLAASGEKWDTVAYSDHHSDLTLLTNATEGFAVNPTPKLRALVAPLNIPIVDWD